MQRSAFYPKEDQDYPATDKHCRIVKDLGLHDDYVTGVLEKMAGSISSVFCLNNLQQSELWNLELHVSKRGLLQWQTGALEIIPTGAEFSLFEGRSFTFI